MRSILVALALSAVALGGCSGCAVLDPNRAVLGETVLDEKTLYAAEAAMFGANTAAEAAVDNGLLKPGSARAVQIADVLDKAKAALDAGRAAYRVGDAKSYGDKLATTQQLVAAAWALIPRKG